MKTKLESLREIVDSEEDWLLLDKKILDSPAEEPVYKVGDWQVPNSDLAELHPAFPAVMRVIFGVYKDDAEKWIYLSGNYVAEALQLLEIGTTKFVDSDGGNYHFVEVKTVSELDGEPDLLRLYGLAAVLKYASYNEKPVPALHHFFDCTAIIPRAFIEANYPNWEKRWNVGKELGMEVRELTRYVFTAEIAPDAPSIDITFE